MSLISALSWVKRGAATQHPSKYVLDDDELKRISTLDRIELEDVKAQLQKAQEEALVLAKEIHDEDEAEDQEEGEDNDDDWVDEAEDGMDVDQEPQKPKNPNDLSQYNLDEYDKDVQTTGPFSNIKGLSYYGDNDDDPYVTLKEDPEEDERAELEILPTDNLLVASKTEDEISQLEIYLYDESQENLYVHHDIMLRNLPLCLEWLNFPPHSSSSTPKNTTGFGNYIAVGTLDPEIEIWSLDVVDPMYPDSILGRPDKTAAHIPVPSGTGKKKKKKPKARAQSSAYHVDAVLSLSWNKVQRNLLASASADRTVKLWDLTRDPSLNGEEGESSGGAIRSFDKMHKDKVQAVQWNEKEPSVLLTGSYDRTVRTFDSRAPEAGVGAVVGADVEALRWDPWETHGFYVSLENGLVLNFDVRTLPSDLNNPSPARFTLSAHDGAVSALDVNPHIKGCLATGGTDKLVKIWNITDIDEAKRNVSLVTSRDLGVGKVFSTTFSPDDPLTIAAAGSKAKLQVWDISANFGVRKAFSSKLHEAGKVLKERAEGEGGSGGVVGVVDDDEEESADEDDE